MEHVNANSEIASQTSGNLDLEAVPTSEGFKNILERLNLLEENYNNELTKNNLLEERLKAKLKIIILKHTELI